MICCCFFGWGLLLIILSVVVAALDAEEGFEREARVENSGGEVDAEVAKVPGFADVASDVLPIGAIADDEAEVVGVLVDPVGSVVIGGIVAAVEHAVFVEEVEGEAGLVLGVSRAGGEGFGEVLAVRGDPAIENLGLLAIGAET